jgi:nuclear transport factor 2 (NTF2) superfamily protein
MKSALPGRCSTLASAPWRRLLGLAGLALLALGLGGGCDFLAVTDEQFVKNKIREHAEAVTARDWAKSARFYDLNVKWQQGATSLQGREAAKGFLGSLNAMSNMDEFFTIVNSIAKVNPELIEAKVTFQAHIVLSSTELNYTNRFWEGRMGWVKRGPGKWQISYIIETTERKEGKFSRI